MLPVVPAGDLGQPTALSNQYCDEYIGSGGDIAVRFRVQVSSTASSFLQDGSQGLDLHCVYNIGDAPGHWILINISNHELSSPETQVAPTVEVIRTSGSGWVAFYCDPKTTVQVNAQLLTWLDSLASRANENAQQ